jgi:MFS transporter, FSR family, fosmidomycin resistance protein
MATSTEQNSKTKKLALEMGGLHALVDCGCGAVIYAEVAAGRMPQEVLLFFVLTYNLLAFGLQWALGWMSDLRGTYRAAAASGAWLVAAAVLVRSSSPWAAAALAGLGNAAFHIGVAGALLPRASGRALEAGLFVGPGALGIFSGVWLGAHVIDWHVVMFPLLVAAGARLLFLIPPKTAAPNFSADFGENFREARNSPAVWAKGCAKVRLLGRLRHLLESVRINRASAVVLAVVLCALFFSTLIRGVVAGVVVGHWRSSAMAGLLMAVAACTGKCLGGWAADRFGWQRTGTIALVASAPFIVAGMHSLALGVCGLLLFQMTMAVTLAGMYQAMPRWPALAFGLPSLALALGMLPDFIPTLQLEEPLMRWLLAPVILLSAALLWIGLGWCRGLPEIIGTPLRDAADFAEAGAALADVSRIGRSDAALRACRMDKPEHCDPARK